MQITQRIGGRPARRFRRGGARIEHGHQRGGARAIIVS